MNFKKSASVFILALTIFLSACSGGSSSSPAEKTSPTGEAASSAIYKDGEYTASATGYSGGLKVKVVIEDDKIKSVEIISHNEVGKQYYEEAIEKIPQAIVLAQSTEVDAITGATKTSKGIIKAVNKVLEEAKLK